MPFTFSHPAVILPFKSVSGEKVSLTALALGSMAPDFEFFFRMRAETEISHTLRGIFLFDLPVILVMAFLYHCWLRNPLIDHLPPFFQKRLSVYKAFDWPAFFKQNWLMVITSGFLGVVTHLLCDDFTHSYGWTAQNLRFLAAQYQIFGMPIPGYHLLQYVSSLLLGLILLLEALYLPPSKANWNLSAFIKYWGLVTLITVPTFVLRFTLRDREMIMDDIIMTAIAAGLLGILVASTASNLIWKERAA